nr:SH3 domain-containing protein [Blautia hydrogenotrophica]
MNIRKGPGTNYAKIGKYTGKGVFTITEVKSGTGSTAGWGKLKSGSGWISLDYCKRL